MADKVHAVGPTAPPETPFVPTPTPGVVAAGGSCHSIKEVELVTVSPRGGTVADGSSKKAKQLDDDGDDATMADKLKNSKLLKNPLLKNGCLLFVKKVVANFVLGFDAITDMLLGAITLERINKAMANFEDTVENGLEEKLMPASVGGLDTEAISPQQWKIMGTVLVVLGFFGASFSTYQIYKKSGLGCGGKGLTEAQLFRLEYMNWAMALLEDIPCTFITCMIIMSSECKYTMLELGSLLMGMADVTYIVYKIMKIAPTEPDLCLTKCFKKIDSCCCFCCFGCLRAGKGCCSRDRMYTVPVLIVLVFAVSINAVTSWGPHGVCNYQNIVDADAMIVIASEKDGVFHCESMLVEDALCLNKRPYECLPIDLFPSAGLKNALTADGVPVNFAEQFCEQTKGLPLGEGGIGDIIYFDEACSEAIDCATADGYIPEEEFQFHHSSPQSQEQAAEESCTTNFDRAGWDFFGTGNTLPTKTTSAVHPTAPNRNDFVYDGKVFFNEWQEPLGLDFGVRNQKGATGHGYMCFTGGLQCNVFFPDIQDDDCIHNTRPEECDLFAELGKRAGGYLTHIFKNHLDNTGLVNTEAVTEAFPPGTFDRVIDEELEEYQRALWRSGLTVDKLHDGVCQWQFESKGCFFDGGSCAEETKGLVLEWLQAKNFRSAGQQTAEQVLYEMILPPYHQAGDRYFTQEAILVALDTLKSEGSVTKTSNSDGKYVFSAVEQRREEEQEAPSSVPMGALERLALMSMSPF